MRKRERTKSKERPDRSLLFHSIFLGLEILLVVLLAFAVSRFFFRTVTIQENSMEPTLSSGDRLFVNRLVYRLRSPKRGEVLVYRQSEDPTEPWHVKRVVGLPGETVQIVNGQLLIDGETYQEKRDLPAIIDAGLAEYPIQLADDEYFVLGDNRNGSEDSRYASVGNIRKKSIYGKTWLRIWPLLGLGGVG